MIQSPKSITAYQSSILANLVQTGITQTSPGGKARAFCDGVGSELGNLETRAFSNLAARLLPYAQGSDLDFYGQISGPIRLAQQDVSSPASDNNFQFYVLSGTFGAINSGNPIVIPSGTQISTGSSTGPVMLVDGDVTLSPGDSVMPFAVIARDGGSAGNAPAGVFTNSSFSNYTDANYGSLLVRNNFGLAQGSEQETDDNYRYRINLWIQSGTSSNEAALRFALLSVPGIQDVVFERLAGTFQVYVYAITPVVPPSLMAMVQAQIDDNDVFPLTGLAVAPDLVGISLDTTLSLASGVSQLDQASIISSAQIAAASYINNLGTSNPLIVNQIASAIFSSDTRILDIGQPNQPLADIFIWRDRADGTRYSRYLISDYTPALGERIVVEPSLTTALNLTIAS